jgi:hypothetical protein
MPPQTGAVKAFGPATVKADEDEGGEGDGEARLWVELM